MLSNKITKQPAMKMKKLDQKSMKMKAALAVINLISPKLSLGIGTGSTVECLIELILKNPSICSNNLAFSSNRSQALLHQLTSPSFSQSFTHLDLYIDGADFISEDGFLIKGGGGALTREKILMQSAKKSFIMVDETKWVYEKKKVVLPIEILPFSHQATLFKISNILKEGHLRKTPHGKIYVTDNGNYIFDALVTFPDHHLKKTCEKLKEIAGVVETGLFAGFHMEVFTAFSDENLPVKKTLFQ